MNAEPTIEQDADAMLDWLQAKTEEGVVLMGIEVDGGLHVTLEPLGGPTSSAREKDTIREAIAELMGKDYQYELETLRKKGWTVIVYLGL